VPEFMSEGKIEELIKQKRTFLRQTMKDYSAGGNDMLDDIENLFGEAKMELTNNLELVSCLLEEDEEVYRKESLQMYRVWFEKWFG